MAGGVDLHTIASDGTLRPRELVAEAARRGVRVLAVTDHDSTLSAPQGNKYGRWLALTGTRALTRPRSWPIFLPLSTAR